MNEYKNKQQNTSKQQIIKCCSEKQHGSLYYEHALDNLISSEWNLTEEEEEEEGACGCEFKENKTESWWLWQSSCRRNGVSSSCRDNKVWH